MPPKVEHYFHKYCVTHWKMELRSISTKALLCMVNIMVPHPNESGASFVVTLHTNVECITQ